MAWSEHLLWAGSAVDIFWSPLEQAGLQSRTLSVHQTGITDRCDLEKLSACHIMKIFIWLSCVGSLDFLKKPVEVFLHNLSGHTSQKSKIKGYHRKTRHKKIKYWVCLCKCNVLTVSTNIQKVAIRRGGWSNRHCWTSRTSALGTVKIL